MQQKFKNESSRPNETHPDDSISAINVPIYAVTQHAPAVTADASFRVTRTAAPLAR